VNLVVKDLAGAPTCWTEISFDLARER